MVIFFLSLPLKEISILFLIFFMDDEQSLVLVLACKFQSEFEFSDCSLSQVWLELFFFAAATAMIYNRSRIYNSNL